MKRVLVIDGHPDPDPARLGHALAHAYAEGAKASGAEARSIVLAEMDFPFLRQAKDFQSAPDNLAILAARAQIEWAEHIVLVFPLWLGSAPALVRAFFEQAARGGFVAEIGKTGWRPHLKGKSGRLIVTMGMPAFAYRLVFGAHGVESWRKSILGFAGVGPIAVTLLGAIEAGAGSAAKRLASVRKLGERLR